MKMAKICAVCWALSQCGWIYSEIHSWSFYTDKYIWIFFCPISMIANIVWIFIVSKKWLKIVIIGPKLVKITKKNMKMAKNGPKHNWANNLIFKYIEIFLTDIFILVYNGQHKAGDWIWTCWRSKMFETGEML